MQKDTWSALGSKKEKKNKFQESIVVQRMKIEPKAQLEKLEAVLDSPKKALTGKVRGRNVAEGTDRVPSQ